jgi:protein SCO1
MNRRTMSTLITVGLAALVVISVIVFNHLASGVTASGAPSPALQGEIVIAKPVAAPGFTLKDQDGQTVSLAQFKGRPVFLIFLDSQCPHGDCELEEQQFGQAYRDLGAQASRVAWIGITVNVSDTPATVDTSLKNNNVHIADFHWLLGAQAEMKPIWDAYGEYVDGTDPKSVIHNDQTFILDKQGKERVYWGDYYLDHRMIAADLKALLAE